MSLLGQGLTLLLISGLFFLIAYFLSKKTMVSGAVLFSFSATALFCLCIGGFRLVEWGADKIDAYFTKDVQCPASYVYVDQCPASHVYVDTPYCGDCGALIIDEEYVDLCPNCGAEADAKFCSECGTSLITICPDCGVECDTPYCGNCGATVQTD